MTLEQLRALAATSFVGVLIGCTETPLPATERGDAAAGGDGLESDIIDELDPVSTPSASEAASAAPAGSTTQDSAGPSSTSCRGLKGSTCTTCCKLSFPLVDATINESLGRCLCTSPAECAAACGANYCSGKPPTATCSTCITQSKVCAPAAKAACDAAPGCTPYMTCMSTCG